MTEVPALGRLRQENLHFDATLSYTVRPSIKIAKSQVLAAHYSGGRNQEDHSSKLGQANSS
jgi:hypothetical protein